MVSAGVAVGWRRRGDGCDCCDLHAHFAKPAAGTATLRPCHPAGSMCPSSGARTSSRGCGGPSWTAGSCRTGGGKRAATGVGTMQLSSKMSSHTVQDAYRCPLCRQFAMDDFQQHVLPLLEKYPLRLRRPAFFTQRNFEVAAAFVASRAFGVDEWHGEVSSSSAMSYALVRRTSRTLCTTCIDRLFRRTTYLPACPPQATQWCPWPTCSTTRPRSWPWPPATRCMAATAMGRAAAAVTMTMTRVTRRGMTAAAAAARTRRRRR